MRYIIIAALEAETPGLELFAPVVHTGVGKVNAAIATCMAIQKFQPSMIINFGTAGALTGLRGLHEIKSIIQHDMDVRQLGFNRGIMPFSANTSLDSEFSPILATGDQFITHPETQLEGLTCTVDLVDMEAFAIREAARAHHIDFRCFKYVSDDGNEDSVSDWSENVANGASIFATYLSGNIGISDIS
jgi:adenosylhomocysteine nucleosidase